MRESTLEKCAKAFKLTERGASQKEACDKAGVSVATYIKWTAEGVKKLAKVSLDVDTEGPPLIARVIQCNLSAEDKAHFIELACRHSAR